jgi:hypothetical protein
LELRKAAAADREEQTIFIGDAHRSDGNRFVVCSDDKLTAFQEFERATHQSADDSKSGDKPISEEV